MQLTENRRPLEQLRTFELFWIDELVGKMDYQSSWLTKNGSWFHGIQTSTSRSAHPTPAAA